MSSAHLAPDPHRLPDPSSTRPPRTPGSGSKVFVFLLLILAVVATVIMFFTDNDFWVNVAVILALWAAFLGTVLVSRYSGALGKEEARAQEQDARYRAELDAQRSEYLRREAELESNYASRDDSEREETLKLIRAELAGMREQLAELSGIDLTEDQVAVRARAERIIELERRTAGPSTTTASTSSTSSATSTRTGGQAVGTENAGAHQGGRTGGFMTGAFSAVNWAGADSQATTMIPMVVDTREARDTPVRSEPTEATTSTASTGPAEPARDPAASAGASAAPMSDSGAGAQHHGSHEAAAQGGGTGQNPFGPSASAVSSAAESPRGPWLNRAADAPAEGDVPHHRRHSDDAAPQDPHGRRRADERDDGNGSVTVAELMAQLKKNAK